MELLPASEKSCMPLSFAKVRDYMIFGLLPNLPEYFVSRLPSSFVKVRD